MKEKIKESLRSIIIDLYGSSDSIHDEFEISIQDNKEKQYGDLASNVALVLAKPLKRNPKEIAEEIKGKFITDKEIIKVDVAGPGFINFFLSKESHGAILRDISIQKDKFGKFESNNKKVLIEYVSSNPTGPLHVGHGRGAVFGSVLSRLLKEAGFQVDEEYYVNDFGRQMNILSASLWIRYAQIFDKNIKMLKNGYRGDYLIAIAQNLKKFRSDELYEDDEEIKSLLENENEDIYAAETLAGHSVLRTVATVLDAISKSPDMYPEMENILFPLLDKFFCEDGLDIIEELLEITTYFTFYSPQISPRMWSLYPKMMQCIETWAGDYMSEFVPALDNFISRGTQTFIQSTNPPYLILTNNALEKCFHQERDGFGTDEETYLACAALIQVILEHCRGLVDHCIRTYTLSDLFLQ